MDRLTNNREQYLIQLLIDFLRGESAEFSHWQQTPGNIIEYEYYTGVETGNPSGEKNVKNVTYKKDGNIKLLQEFEYDLDNFITKVTSS